MLLLILAAAQPTITLPAIRTGSLEPKFTATMNEGGLAATKVKVVVSFEGVPIRCDIAFPSEAQTNGEALCAMILREVRYSPALAETSKPVAGITFVWSQWNKGKWLGSEPPDWDPVDLALEVNRMPPGFKEMSTFHLRLLLDTAGKIQACEVGEAKLARQAKELLCNELKRETIPPALNEKGVAIAAVRPVRVRLVSSRFNKRLISRLRGE